MCHHCRNQPGGCIHCREAKLENRRREAQGRRNKTFEERIALGLIAGPMWSKPMDGETRSRRPPTRHGLGHKMKQLGNSVLPVDFCLC